MHPFAVALIFGRVGKIATLFCLAKNFTQCCTVFFLQCAAKLSPYLAKPFGRLQDVVAVVA